MSKSKKIQVMVWRTDGADESTWYRLSNPNEGQQFFEHLLANAELDGRESFDLIEVSEEEWQKAEDIGKSMA